MPGSDILQSPIGPRNSSETHRLLSAAPVQTKGSVLADMNPVMNGLLNDETHAVPEEFASFTRLLDVLLSVAREDAQAREPFRARKPKAARPLNSPEPPDTSPDPAVCQEPEASTP